MTATLQGVRFDQIYGDNSGTNNGQQPFDTDGDGRATQEDEFVSFTNTNTAPMDVSGWQIWSDSAGTGAADTPSDGLFHTFPPGTVLQPGETLYIINEISGPAPSWAQEASEGGIESGSGGQSTNLLSEGTNGNASDAIALVDPNSGDYIVFNMAPDPPQIQNLPGFTGNQNVGTIDGEAVMQDAPAGTAYRYNADKDTYTAREVSIPCFVAGTLIATPDGPRAIETLRIGDLVLTLDSGPQPVRWTGARNLDHATLCRTGQHPIEFKSGSLGNATPERTLCVSPQHRILLNDSVLAPARGLLALPKVRLKRGCRQVSYHHILLPGHEVIFAEGAPVESLLVGPAFLADCRITDRLRLMPDCGSFPTPARPCLTVQQARKGIETQYRRGGRAAHFPPDLNTRETVFANRTPPPNAKCTGSLAPQTPP